MTATATIAPLSKKFAIDAVVNAWVTDLDDKANISPFGASNAEEEESDREALAEQAFLFLGRVAVDRDAALAEWISVLAPHAREEAAARIIERAHEIADR